MAWSEAGVAARLENAAVELTVQIYERWKLERPEMAKAYDEGVAVVRQKRAMRRALGFNVAPEDYVPPAHLDCEPYFWHTPPPAEPGGAPMDAPDPQHAWYAWAFRRLASLPATWQAAYERGAARATAASWPPHIAECWAFRVLWAKWLTTKRGAT